MVFFITVYFPRVRFQASLLWLGVVLGGQASFCEQTSPNKQRGAKEDEDEEEEEEEGEEEDS